MFEAWYPTFVENNGDVAFDTAVTTGDNGTPTGKDLDYLLKKVITADNKLRIVVSA